tara:strand:- start:1640 stop:1846 length:207 start_codon:yes stop_codon:yes gene_type:complete
MNEKRVWEYHLNGLTCIEEQIAYLRRNVDILSDMKEQVYEEEVDMLERHVDGLKEKIERLERRLEEEK